MEGHVLSHGDGVWSSIPWGSGSLCKMLYVLQLSISHIILTLVPINRHWWVHFFWSVTRTNACEWPWVFMPVSYLDLLDKISLCQFITALTSMDADPNMYPILIPPASNTSHFCHHPQPHHSQPYHTQSIIYHPSFIINGNSRYRAYSTTISIFLIFSRLPSLICPPLNSVKWSSPQNDSCHRR